MSMPLSPEAAMGADQARAHLLVVTKRRATCLLGLMTAVFVTAVLAGDSRGLARVAPAALAVRALTSMMAAGYHQEAFDAVLRAAARFLDEHRNDLRERFLRESKWYQPDVINKRIFATLLDGALKMIDDIRADPEHPLRAEVDRRLVALVKKLETSRPLRARIARSKHELQAKVPIPQLAARLWTY